MRQYLITSTLPLACAAGTSEGLLRACWRAQVCPRELVHSQALVSGVRAPQAFSNTLKRMLEAAGRGMWQADAATLEKLQSMYAEIGDELEGVR